MTGGSDSQRESSSLSLVWKLNYGRTAHNGFIKNYQRHNVTDQCAVNFVLMGNKRDNLCDYNNHD